jgi:hypothetical protein
MTIEFINGNLITNTCIIRQIDGSRINLLTFKFIYKFESLNRKNIISKIIAYIKAKRTFEIVKRDKALAYFLIPLSEILLLKCSIPYDKQTKKDLEELCRTISHESIHYVLAINESWDTCTSFDNIAFQLEQEKYLG